MLGAELTGVFDVLPDGVVASDERGLILYVNPGIERMLGWNRAEIVGQPLTAIMPERLHAAHQAGFRHYFDTHEPRIMGRPVRLPGLRKDGEEVDLELTVSAVQLGGHEVTIAVLRDLRERIELERQVHISRYMASATRLTARVAARHELEQVLSTAAHALVEEFAATRAEVWLVDEEEGALDLHALAEAGLPAAEVPEARIDIARDPSIVARAARAQRAVFQGDLGAEAVLAPGFRVRPGLTAMAAIPLLLRDALVGVAVAYFREPLVLEAQEVLASVGTTLATAVGDARLMAEVEAASRAKDEFLAMLGHELRNPLAPILTAVHLMKMRGDDRAQRERDVIERHARHLVELVEDLLDVSKVARGMITLRRARVEIGAAVARAIEMTSPLFEQQGHRLDVIVPDGLFVDGDATRLAQIFANLLTNAAKYTPPGGSISVGAMVEQGMVVVRVRDNGAGIDPVLLPRLFDLFVQGPRGRDRRQGGLGIGLALVRGLVRLHGGEVSASSAGLGSGSEFEVRLPAQPGALPTVGAPAPAPPIIQPGGARRVLVVDDNADAAEQLAELLREAGHDVRVAFDPVLGLKEAAAFSPDVAVLDIGLPVMDGYELAEQLRVQLGQAVPRLIAVTGYGQASDRQRSSEAGFVEHLVKPIDLEQLLRVVAAG